MLLPAADARREACHILDRTEADLQQVAVQVETLACRTSNALVALQGAIRFFRNQLANEVREAWETEGPFSLRNSAGSPID